MTLAENSTLSLIQKILDANSEQLCLRCVNELENRGIIKKDGNQNPTIDGKRIHFGLDQDIRSTSGTGQEEEEDIFVIHSDYIDIVEGDIESSEIYSPVEFCREYNLTENIICEDLANFWNKVEEQTKVSFNKGYITFDGENSRTAFADFINFLIREGYIGEDIGIMKLGRKNRSLISRDGTHPTGKDLIAPVELQNGMYVETTMANARKKIIVSKIIQRIIDNKPLDGNNVKY